MAVTALARPPLPPRPRHRASTSAKRTSSSASPRCQASVSLTAKETQHLEKEQARVNNAEAKAKSDGGGHREGTPPAAAQAGRRQCRHPPREAQHRPAGEPQVITPPLSVPSAPSPTGRRQHEKTPLRARPQVLVGAKGLSPCGADAMPALKRSGGHASMVRVDVLILRRQKHDARRHARETLRRPASIRAPAGTAPCATRPASSAASAAARFSGRSRTSTAACAAPRRADHRWRTPPAPHAAPARTRRARGCLSSASHARQPPRTAQYGCVSNCLVDLAAHRAASARAQASASSAISILSMRCGASNSTWTVRARRSAPAARCARSGGLGRQETHEAEALRPRVPGDAERRRGAAGAGQRHRTAHAGLAAAATSTAPGFARSPACPRR